MHAVVQKLIRSLSQWRIRDGVLLVAVSGGADSVALLCSLWEIKDQYNLDLRVIHVNHQLRDSATADAEWVHVLCNSRSVPCAVEEVQLQADHREQRVSEEAARTARYNTFKSVSKLTGARWLATAHTANDQTETVLHHILRGTSWRGLRGIPSRRLLTENCLLIRPFLQVTRTEIEDFLTELNQGFRIDSSNAESHYTRNRLRSRVLPFLREEYGSQVDESLRRLGGQAAALVDYVELQAHDLLQQVILEQTSRQVRLSCAGLNNLAALLIREMCVLLWERQNWPRQAMAFRHWNLLSEVLQGETDRKEILPGELTLERRGQLVVLSAPS